ncbi:MAG: NAD(P)/FAD-dependent oxidoreductase [Gammaproteobacteria bacterium]|nr:NAD(P)/FAD-dependent oxidoreductase [Gammaproteobacteria bacterium]
MSHIVIIGAGIGGLPTAYDLRKTLKSEHTITVISPVDYFQFTPSNPWVAVGWRNPDEIKVPIEEPLKRKGIELITESAKLVHAEQSQVELSSGRIIDYDYLIIATGPKLAFEEVLGLGPDAGYTQSICTTSHAQHAWAAYEEFLKNPGPIVIGAAAGASCFGPAYEFALIIAADLRKRKIRHKVPMTYVTSEPYIGHMGLGGVGDSKGLLESTLREFDIKWITNAKIKEASTDMIYVSEMDSNGQVTKEHSLPHAFSMILPAFKGVDAVANVDGLCNPRGFVLIDEHQRNPKYRNIFATGVCVAIPPVEVTPVPTGAPKTGYMIESMSSAIVENIKADIEGKAAHAKATWNAICLADMGDTGVAFVALPQIPPRNLTWAKKGKWVHLAKIAFEKYFIRKMKTGNPEPYYEKYIFKALGIVRLQDEK